jgi:hypothetical protein
MKTKQQVVKILTDQIAFYARRVQSLERAISVAQNKSESWKTAQRKNINLALGTKQGLELALEEIREME